MLSFTCTRLQVTNQPRHERQVLYACARIFFSEKNNRVGTMGRTSSNLTAALCAAAGLLMLVPHHGHAYLVWRSGAIHHYKHLLARCPPLRLHSRPSAPCTSLRLKLRSDSRSTHAVQYVCVCARTHTNFCSHCGIARKARSALTPQSSAVTP